MINKAISSNAVYKKGIVKKIMWFVYASDLHSGRHGHSVDDTIMSKCIMTILDCEVFMCL